jgi:hypothetical protein
MLPVEGMDPATSPPVTFQVRSGFARVERLTRPDTSTVLPEITRPQKGKLQ